MKHKDKDLLQQTKVPGEEKWCWLLWVTLLCKMSANESLAFVYLSEVHWKLKMTSNSELTSNHKGGKKPSNFLTLKGEREKVETFERVEFLLGSSMRGHFWTFMRKAISWWLIGSCYIPRSNRCCTASSSLIFCFRGCTNSGVIFYPYWPQGSSIEEPLLPRPKNPSSQNRLLHLCTKCPGHKVRQKSTTLTFWDYIFSVARATKSNSCRSRFSLHAWEV